MTETSAVRELTAGALAAGRYTRSSFSPRITFAVSGPWQGVQLFTGFFDVQQDVGSPDVISVQFARPSAVHGARGATTPPSATAAADALAGNSALVIVDRATTTIGGLTGPRVTVENGGAPSAAVIDVAPGTLSILTGRRLRIAFLDTSAGLLAIMVGGSVAKWGAALAVAQPVLDSITVDR